MIKLGLKNYFKSFRYFLVPIGALALGIVFGLSIAIPVIWGAIKTFISGVAKEIGSITVHWDAVGETMFAAFKKFDWANPESILSEISTETYWGALLRDCATAAFGDLSEMKAQIEALIEQAMKAVTAGIVSAVFFTVVGAIAGLVVTRSMIRTDVANRSFFKTILPRILGGIVNVIIFLLASFLILKVQKYAILQFILFLLLYAVVSFVESYFVYGFKKVPFKKVLNIKNILFLLLLSAIEIVIMIVILAILNALVNTALMVFVGYSVVVITLCCLQLNDEAYVKNLATEGGFGVRLAESAPMPSELIPLPTDASATEEVPADAAEEVAEEVTADVTEEVASNKAEEGSEAPAAENTK